MEEDREYYLARERDELEAAEKAATPEARWAHEELAREYARRRSSAPPPEQP